MNSCNHNCSQGRQCDCGVWDEAYKKLSAITMEDENDGPWEPAGAELLDILAAISLIIFCFLGALSLLGVA